MAEAFWFVIGAVLTFLLRDFLPSYGREKGKNLATKEDIGEITNRIESVKTQYATVIEQLRGRNSLRAAAIERRLEVHQQAFSLWSEMGTLLFDEPMRDSHLEACEKFWVENCLYLEASASTAFTDAMVALRIHKRLRDIPVHQRDSETAARLKANHDRITGAGNKIRAAVELPSLTSEEIRLSGFGGNIDGGTY